MLHLVVCCVGWVHCFWIHFLWEFPGCWNVMLARKFYLASSLSLADCVVETTELWQSMERAWHSACTLQRMFCSIKYKINDDVFGFHPVSYVIQYIMVIPLPACWLYNWEQIYHSTRITTLSDVCNVFILHFRPLWSCAATGATQRYHSHSSTRLFNVLNRRNFLLLVWL